MKNNHLRMLNQSRTVAVGAIVAAAVLANGTLGVDDVRGQGTAPSVASAEASTKPNSQPERLETEFPCMGARFRIVAYAADVEEGRKAVQQAILRAKALDEVLSDYLRESALNRLCRQAPVRDAQAPRDLWTVLGVAERISRASDGAFDPTIGPLSRLWRAARKSKTPPSEDALAEALARTGAARLLRVDSQRPRISLLAAEMQLDLGGIAKGFAADQALQTLRKAGIAVALVDAGGDMAIGDAPPNARGWRIAVTGWRDAEQIEDVLELSNVGVATSGDLWQFVEFNGKRYSHLIDPRTGWGVVRRSRVTAVARDATLADAWASAASVMAPEKAVDAWERNKVEGSLVWLPASADKEQPPRSRETRGWSALPRPKRKPKLGVPQL